MITISLVDPSLEASLAAPADLQLRATGDYVAGYSQIVQAIHANQHLHVAVYDKTVGKWLAILATKYGPGCVAIEELTLRGQLRKQISLEIPEQVTDRQIEEARLLEINIPAPPNISFEDYILEVFFGNFLTLPGGLRRIGDIISGYEPEQWKAAFQRPLVKDIYQRKVRALRQELIQERKAGEEQLLDWLEISPDALIRNLFALKVLAGYPEELGKSAIGKVFGDLLKLNLDLRKVPSIVKGNEKTIDEIRLYLARWETTNPTDIWGLLTQVSGTLEIEFDTIYRLLTTSTAVSAELVQQVQNKFRPIRFSPKMDQALADLDLLITKAPPPKPVDGWKEADWIRWAVEDYLPYRFWLENTGQLNDEIGETANQYAEWLNQNYGQMLFNSSHMAWKAILGLRDAFKDYLGPILVVMVDNLNAKFYPDLLRQMQSQGYYEQRMTYYFSMLPSCTQVSKKCLLTGHFAPFEGQAYKTPVEETWAKKLGKRVLYVANIGEFRAISQRAHDVYFLNYLPLDITLHQDENQTGISHAQAIRSYLAALAQDIHSFAQKIGAERDLMVVITSDHGSTRIPKGTVNVIQRKFYEDRANDEHHRYLTVSDGEFKKLEKEVGYECYAFDRKIYQLDTNYLVARRLYRFLPTGASAYIHGGLTPEETLVPIAIYQPIAVSPKPLAIRLLEGNKVYVGTKIDLTFEVTNLNAYACERVEIELSDPNFTVEKVTIDEIAKLKRLPLTLSARCHRTADPSARKLHLRVTYHFLEQPWVNELDVPIGIVEPAKQKFDLDNL